MLLGTILCKFGQVCAAGNAFVRLVVGRNSILNFPAKIWTGMCRALLCATKNALMQLKTILCKFGQICATGNPFQWLTVGRNSILNFPAKIRTGMCRALLCGDWWWLITQPRPIWKKAPPGLQRPSHTEWCVPWVLYWPNPSVPQLRPDLRGYIGYIPHRG